MVKFVSACGENWRPRDGAGCAPVMPSPSGEAETSRNSPVLSLSVYRRGVNCGASSESQSWGWVVDWSSSKGGRGH